MQGAPSPYVISARPGSLNYFEGKVWLNQEALAQEMIGKTFLNTKDVLATSKGKAEILLTPGIFLRIGDDSQIRITASSLIDVQIELLSGEAMIEADELMKGNSVQVRIQGAVASLRKPGLYRFTAGEQPSAAALSGKEVLSDEVTDDAGGAGQVEPERQ